MKVLFEALSQPVKEKIVIFIFQWRILPGNRDAVIANEG
jgi:hypothetical protein